MLRELIENKEMKILKKFPRIEDGNLLWRFRHRKVIMRLREPDEWIFTVGPVGATYYTNRGK